MHLKKHKMLPSKDDGLNINSNRTCDVIKEDCIPLRIIKNWFPKHCASFKISVLDSILGRYPATVNQEKVAEVPGDFYS